MELCLPLKVIDSCKLNFMLDLVIFAFCKGKVTECTQVYKEELKCGKKCAVYIVFIIVSYSVRLEIIVLLVFNVAKHKIT